MQVITRINYGQSVAISGLAGAVSLAGADGGLWSIKGGNWQMASGLIAHSNVELHLHEEIESISFLKKYYELNSTKGKSYKCDVAVVATPLDEVNIQFTPLVSIPKRSLQHTHATFVRGLLNPVSSLLSLFTFPLTLFCHSFIQYSFYIFLNLYVLLFPRNILASMRYPKYQNWWEQLRLLIFHSRAFQFLSNMMKKI